MTPFILPTLLPALAGLGFSAIVQAQELRPLHEATSGKIEFTSVARDSSTAQAVRKTLKFTESITTVSPSHLPTGSQFGEIQIVVVVVLVAGGVAYLRQTGLRAQAEPGAIETLVARQVRSLAIPDDVRALRNPLPPTQENVRAGMEHFATYCAMCHGNDGSGQRSAIGRGLFPKPPDMRVDPTQSLTDGELFYIIKNGIRFTGMPGWGGSDEDNWKLVLFIRHLPNLTPNELEYMTDINHMPADSEAGH